MADSLELSPAEVRSRLAAGTGMTLIDVREPDEFQLARLEGSELIPMQSVPTQLQRLEGWADEVS